MWAGIPAFRGPSQRLGACQRAHSPQKVLECRADGQQSQSAWQGAGRVQGAAAARYPCSLALGRQPYRR
jgi:hypothetical protein